MNARKRRGPGHDGPDARPVARDGNSGNGSAQVRRHPADPARMTVTPFWADLLATLDAYDLLPLLDAQLAKPALGNPKFAAGRARCRVRWAESALAVARLRLADADARKDAA